MRHSLNDETFLMLWRPFQWKISFTFDKENCFKNNKSMLIVGASFIHIRRQACLWRSSRVWWRERHGFYGQKECLWRVWGNYRTAPRIDWPPTLCPATRKYLGIPLSKQDHAFYEVNMQAIWGSKLSAHIESGTLKVCYYRFTFTEELHGRHCPETYLIPQVC